MTVYALVVDDPGGVDLAANLTVSNVLTLSAGTMTVGPHTLTISNPLAGTIENLAAGATSRVVVQGTAAGIALPNTVDQLEALTVNNANGLALDGDLTVLSTLTLTNGPVTTGAWYRQSRPAERGPHRWPGERLSAEARPGGGGTTVTFEVGDATRYAPVTVVFGTVSVADDLTARTVAGDHPDIVTPGSHRP